MQSTARPKVSRNIIGWFLSFYRPHIGLFSLDMACASMIAVVDLAFPLATKYALETLLPNNLYQIFFGMIIALVVAYVFRSVMYYVVTHYGHYMGVLIEADMRSSLFAHLQKLSFRFFDKTRTGQLMSRVLNDLFDVTELAHHGPEDLFISLITLVGAFIVLVRVNWILTTAIFAMLPIILFFIVRQRRRLRDTSVRVRERMAGINTEIESSISGVRVAKAFTNEDFEMHKFQQGNDRYKQAKGEQYRAMAMFHSGMEFMLAIMPLLVIAVGGSLILWDGLNYIDLITFNLYVASFLQPIRKLTNFVEQFTTGMSGFMRFTELMNTEPDIMDAPGARPLENVRGDIEFKNVSFSYNEGVDVLRNVNLTVRPGSTLALVGPSGGGKSTLCQLIPRFYETTGGEILIDGRPIKSITLASLRGNIGIVQQDVFLFAGTVRDNIRYGRVDATEQEIVQAAIQAEIHDDIMEMPDGYDTVVGERGITLSGGQKQRVSIARIFLKNPPILILDEATSALDTQTELKIQAAFDKLSVGRTSLIIAHRLSTIRDADEIVVIGEDGILEQGTHQALLAKGGHYAHLHNAQFRLIGTA